MSKVVPDTFYGSKKPIWYSGVGMLVLEVIDGPDLGSTFPLPQGEPQLIGRSSESLPLTDPTVSRRHAELTPDGNKWFLRDLDSSNGTFLNGRRLVDRVALRSSDEVGCGSTLFLVTERASLPTETILSSTNLDTSAESVIVTSPHSFQAAKNHLRMVYRLTAATAGTVDSRAILQRLIAVVADEFKPDRAIGVLFDDDANIATSIEAIDGNLLDKAQPYCESLVLHVCNERRGLLIADITEDIRFSRDGAVIASDIRGCICVPLIAHDQVLGAILLEAHSATRHWTDEEFQLLTAATEHTGLAILTANLVRTRLHHERLAAMGETVASISHSVKNILQGLRSGAGGTPDGVPCRARIRARQAAADRIRGRAAEQCRYRHGAPYLPSYGSGVPAHDGGASGHYAANRAHRPDPAERCPTAVKGFLRR